MGSLQCDRCEASLVACTEEKVYKNPYPWKLCDKCILHVRSFTHQVKKSTKEITHTMEEFVRNYSTFVWTSWTTRPRLQCRMNSSQEHFYAKHKALFEDLSRILATEICLQKNYERPGVSSITLENGEVVELLPEICHIDRTKTCKNGCEQFVSIGKDFCSAWCEYLNEQLNLLAQLSLALRHYKIEMKYQKKLSQQNRTRVDQVLEVITVNEPSAIQFLQNESSRFLLINVVKEKVELEKRLEELEVKLQQAMESSNLIDEEDQKDEEDTSIGEDEYEAERRTVDCSICGLPLIPSRSVQHMKMCWLEAKQEHPSQKYHSNLDISSPAWIMKIESIRAAKDSVVAALDVLYSFAHQLIYQEETESFRSLILPLQSVDELV